jgi:uncharacterized protein YndB with AHSA1/START domain
VHAALTFQPPSNPIAPTTTSKCSHASSPEQPRGLDPRPDTVGITRRVTEIHIEQRFSAPPDRVFAAVTDHRRLESWQPGTKVTIERQGVPAPNGLGAIRKVKTGPLTIYEEVVRWEEPEAMDYHLFRGAPLRDHLGEIRLAPVADGGTMVSYRIRFTMPWYVGGDLAARLVARQLRAVIAAAYARLAEEIR